ncbi:MAG: hypothetical protein ABL955_09485 [Elusimicrobiota bacterium]
MLQNFPGSSALTEQAKIAKVSGECACGCSSIIFSIPANAPIATVLQRVPVEAASKDADGMGLHFLLHVVGGILHELEIFREDSEPVKKLPEAETLTVIAFRPASN